MEEITKIAKYGYEEKVYACKRKIYQASTLDEVDEMVAKNGIGTSALNLLNAKVVIEVQNKMRNALKEKNGHKAITSGGEAVDMSEVEEV